MSHVIKLCQRVSLVKSSASPVIFEFPYIAVLLLIPGEKCSKLFPGKNLKVHQVTWPGCIVQNEKRLYAKRFWVKVTILAFLKAG